MDKFIKKTKGKPNQSFILNGRILCSTFEFFNLNGEIRQLL